MKTNTIIRSMLVLTIGSFLSVQSLYSQTGTSRRSGSSRSEARQSSANARQESRSSNRNQDKKIAGNDKKQPDRGIQQNMQRPSGSKNQASKDRDKRPQNNQQGYQQSQKQHHNSNVYSSRYGNRHDSYKTSYIRHHSNRYVNRMPPPLRDERHLRYDRRYYNRGYVWVPGFWEWDFRLSSYYWVNGYWVRDRVGYVYYPGYWEPVGGGLYIWIEGGWFLGG